MNILTSHGSAQGRPTPGPSQPFYARPGTQAWAAREAAQLPNLTAGHAPVESGEPLDEAVVELPHVLLEMFPPKSHLVESVGTAAVSGLAVVRAAQLFRLPGWEAKMEGASAVALAAAGVASMVPGGLSHGIGHTATLGHGVIETTLGAHQLREAIRDPHTGWSQVADGVLGMAKGLAVLTPMVIPGLEHVCHAVELGALIGRAGLKLAHPD